MINLTCSVLYCDNVSVGIMLQCGRFNAKEYFKAVTYFII